MTASAPRAYLDSCVYINVFRFGQSDPVDWLKRSVDVVHRCQSGQLSLVGSALVIAEVCGNGGIRGSHLTPKVRRRRSAEARAFFRDNDFLVVDVDRRIADQAVDLAFEHQLTGCDAIHLASAAAAGCAVLYSWDEDLLKVEALGNMKIIEPDLSTRQLTLNV